MDPYHASALVQSRQKSGRARKTDFGRRGPEDAREVAGATTAVRKAELTADRHRQMETPR